MRIWALDDRTFDHCGIELHTAAKARGYASTLFRNAAEVIDPGYVFTRLCQTQPRLTYDRGVYRDLASREGIRCIQDPWQVEAYEDKGVQTKLWGDFMPTTCVRYSRPQLRNGEYMLPFPIISKSFIGSASHNVRILNNAEQAEKELNLIFSPSGMKVTSGVQKNYVLWQEFVPHTCTYRVTLVGRYVHVYKRFNYLDRPMAAPSKVIRTQPLKMSSEVESLLEFCEKFFAAANTKWCAIDVLKNPTGGWKLLETALGWARGDDESGNAKFYGSKWSLLTQHELLLDEMQDGVF